MASRGASKVTPTPLGLLGTLIERLQAKWAAEYPVGVPWVRMLSDVQVALPHDHFSTVEVEQALRNSGVDTDCGACMEVAFSGVTTNQHTCKALPPAPPQEQDLERLALEYHKTVEGEYGCGYPQTKCPGVLRLIKLLESVAQQTNTRMLRALELVESVYRQNVVQPGEPSSILEELRAAIAVGRAASPPAQAQELATLRSELVDLKAAHQSCLDGDEAWAAKWKTIAEERLKGWNEATRAAQEAEAKLAALPQAHGWQPIETAPKDGTQLMFWVGSHIIHVCWRDGYWEWLSGGRLPVGQYRMTHWMPLPDPPVARPTEQP